MVWKEMVQRIHIVSVFFHLLTFLLFIYFIFYTFYSPIFFLGVLMTVLFLCCFTVFWLIHLGAHSQPTHVFIYLLKMCFLKICLNHKTAKKKTKPKKTMMVVYSFQKY